MSAKTYEFETIDQVGFHTPNYYRLDRPYHNTNIIQDRYIPIQQQNNYSSYPRTIENLNQNHNMQIHRAYENEQIHNRVPDLSISSNKKSILLANRTNPTPTILSPLKNYTNKLINSPLHQSPIYSGSIHRELSPIRQIRNLDGQSLYYNGLQGNTQDGIGSSVPPPPIEKFYEQPVYSQMINCQTYFPSNPQFYHHGNHASFANHANNNYIGIDERQNELMDVYSELPKDQCYYCVQNLGVNKINAEQYYNKEWVEEKDRKQHQSIKQYEKQNKNTSYFENEWEREIEKDTKKRKQQKNDDNDIQDNISVESEITKKPQEYVLPFQDMGVDNREINDIMNKEKQKNQNKLGGFIKASVFLKKISDKAQQTKFQKEVNQVGEMFNDQEIDFQKFENLEFTDLDHLTDEEKKKLLYQYELINRMNDEMRNENSITDIQSEVIINQLDNLYKRVSKS